jgi:hypothetical protein
VSAQGPQRKAETIGLENDRLTDDNLGTRRHSHRSNHVSHYMLSGSCQYTRTYHGCTLHPRTRIHLGHSLPCGSPITMKKCYIGNLPYTARRVHGSARRVHKSGPRTIITSHPCTLQAETELLQKRGHGRGDRGKTLRALRPQMHGTCQFRMYTTNSSKTRRSAQPHPSAEMRHLVPPLLVIRIACQCLSQSHLWHSCEQLHCPTMNTLLVKQTKESHE